MSNLFGSSPVANMIPFDGTAYGMTSTNLADAVMEAVQKGTDNLETTIITATGPLSTSSGQYQRIDQMVSTPVAGTYMVIFGAKMTTSGASARGAYALFKDGVIVDDSERECSTNIALLGLITISLDTIGVGAFTSSIITLDGNQSIEVKYKSINGLSIACSSRNLTLVRVA